MLFYICSVYLSYRSLIFVDEITQNFEISSCLEVGKDLQNFEMAIAGEKEYI